MGPKSCSPEGRCTHTDYDGAQDESTLQVCQAGGYVSIDLFRNSSSCRREKRAFGFNTTLGVCARVGAYFGIMSCGEKKTGSVFMSSRRTYIM